MKKFEQRMERETAQLEALLAIDKELRLERALPPSRGWAASPDVLRMLLDTARSRRPATIVECGSGLSTLILARALQLNGSGHVYSLDHSAEFASSVRAQLESYDLSHWATVIHAPLTPIQIQTRQWMWYDLSQLRPRTFDMLVIDGPPQSVGGKARYPAGPLLFDRLSAGGVAFLDDASRGGERAIAKIWQREFPNLRQRYFRFDKGLLVLEKKP